jgi:hypothetical protein
LIGTDPSASSEISAMVCILKFSFAHLLFQITSGYFFPSKRHSLKYQQQRHKAKIYTGNFRDEDENLPLNMFYQSCVIQVSTFICVYTGYENFFSKNSSGSTSTTPSGS